MVKKKVVKKNKSEINPWLYWSPRILTILFIGFLALFSLDIFGNGFWQTVLGLFMHNIPSLVLLVVLLIAWKYEIVGAVGYVLAGLVYILSLIPRFQVYMVTWIIAIAIPAFVIGVLWWLNWKRRR